MEISSKTEGIKAETDAIKAATGGRRKKKKKKQNIRTT
jgi:hypothetical protein